MDIDVQVISKLQPIYKPYRYKVLYGGRASGKSLAVADYLLVMSAFTKYRILCCREYQSSIKDSVHRTLCDRIEALNLLDYFIITRDEIRSKSGSIFIFKGLRQNYQEIKSTQGINYCWIEEAERVSEDSWNVLIPTIREEKSEIIITFNPSDEKNPTYQRFIKNTPQNCIAIKINYDENPFLPDVLLQEIEYDKKYNPDKFAHVWEGECAKMSNAVVFKSKFEVKEFKLEIVHDKLILFNNERIKFKYGLDFGFSKDPLAVIEAFVHDGILYITNEIYGYHVETDDIISLIKSHIPNAMRGKIYADSARPETIAQLSKVRTHREGYLLESLNIQGAIKGKGSVKEGIAFLLNFKKIVIHPCCKNTIYEFENYSYIQDKTTGDIQSDLSDKDNHLIDALRYAFNDEIQAIRKTLRINENIIQNFM